MMVHKITEKEAIGKVIADARLLLDDVRRGYAGKEELVKYLLDIIKLEELIMAAETHEDSSFKEMEEKLSLGTRRSFLAEKDALFAIERMKKQRDMRKIRLHV